MIPNSLDSFFILHYFHCLVLIGTLGQFPWLRLHMAHSLFHINSSLMFFGSCANSLIYNSMSLSSFHISLTVLSLSVTFGKFGYSEFIWHIRNSSLLWMSFIFMHSLVNSVNQYLHGLSFSTLFWLHGANRCSFANSVIQNSHSTFIITRFLQWPRLI